MNNPAQTGTGIFWAARLLAVSWMGLIFYLSSQSGLPTPTLFPGQDKVAHILIYSVLGIFYWVALYGIHQRPALPAIVWITLLVFFYGLTDEFHQSLVPGRAVEGLDVLADTIGGFLGATLAYKQAPRLFQDSGQI